MSSLKPNIKALAKEGRVDEIITALEHENPSVREKAAKALGNLGDTMAVGPLIKCLEDSYPFTRQKAIDALGKLGDPKAVDPLIKCLEDTDPIVKDKAIKALGKLGDPKAADSLMPLLQDGTFYVRDAAERTMRELGVSPDEHIREIRDAKERKGKNEANAYKYARPLSDAAGSGKLEQVKRFIDMGADVDYVVPDTGDGSRALHWALFAKSSPTKYELVELLIDNGADVNARTKRGQTQEERALRWVNVDVLEGIRYVSKKLFGDQSPLVDVGLAPLDIAAITNEKEIASMLIARGADVNARGENAETALHLTAVYGAYETAEVLIAAGADVSARTEGGLGETAWGGSPEGGTPLQWAERRLEQATLPKQLRAKVEAIAELIRSAETPLEAAEKVRCHQCGKENRRESRFCVYCGAEQERYWRAERTTEAVSYTHLRAHET